MIESNLDNMTHSEKTVAKYFLNQTSVEDLSTDAFCHKLHVSKATLTRFSKKCGFKGFREFIFHYKEMLRKNYSVINERKLERITTMIESAERVYLYGKGSSALALKEMKMRFMRLGIICEMIEDEDMFIWNNLLVNEKCLVIGASISGKTKTVLDALQTAKIYGAHTVLMTTRNMNKSDFCCDEILLLAAADHLAYGNRISPQLPILLMTDCLFSYYLENPDCKYYFEQTIINKDTEFKFKNDV
ncbi:MurR/RpiR family transcriptional regulator [Staphylococcus coagulans]|uniref:MurR/RpiR family transcriptional regulator n=1 Tax=Staphylococcus coagulans TaxID=74706 RepID=UPI001FDA4A7C|nr:MurR/RpiR family transcriptional regulator [Staphylococcus coagulans]